LISNQVAYIKRTDTRASQDQNAEAKEVEEGNHREAMEVEAQAQGLFMLPEYEFDHCVYSISEKELTEGGLVYGYNKAMNFLRLKDRPDVGLTCVVTGRWMFAGILTAPYTTNTNGCPVYLDGFSFSGLVSLQTVDAKWPATAGLECHEPTIFEAMSNSTYYANISEVVVAQETDPDKGEDSEGNPNDNQSEAKSQQA
jgi:hypothetical protein